jgi:hypothetical protein
MTHSGDKKQQDALQEFQQTQTRTLPCLPDEVHAFSRRQILTTGAAVVGYASVARLLGMPAVAMGQAPEQTTFPVLRKLVWINMSGGWDILESVDPKKTSTANLDVGYDFNLTHPLAGAPADVRLGRFFPGVASLGDDVLLLRGLAMGTTSHDAGSVYMDTGILSNTGRVNAASIPSIVASESDATIPIIQLGGGMEPMLDRGLLKPVSLVRAQNLDLYRSMYPTEKAAVDRKLAMLDYLKKSVARAKAKVGTNDRLGAVEAAESKIRGQIASGIGSKLQLTDADRAPFAAAAANMRGGPADAFALALKLLNNDLVTCVNMGLGGFDTHANQDRQLSTLLPPFDVALTAFVKELRKSKKLESTLIVLYSDFGRTAKINGSAGRDHWPVGGAMILGGNIDGARAVGGTTGDLLAQDFDPATGNAVREGNGQQLTPKHLGAAVVRLCLGDDYLRYRTYLSKEDGDVDSDALVRLRS